MKAIALPNKFLILYVILFSLFLHLCHSEVFCSILRNNSFSGFIPGEYRNLNELELLDLGYNSFCEPIRHDFEHNIQIL